MNHDDVSYGAPDVPTTEDAAELANALPATLQEAYADGRKDQLQEDVELLGWAYSKLCRLGFNSMESAMMMDRIKLLIEHGIR